MMSKSVRFSSTLAALGAVALLQLLIRHSDGFILPSSPTFRSTVPSHHRSFVGRPLFVSSASTEVDTSTIPHLADSYFESLSRDGYVVVPNFLPASLVSSLRQDVDQLRQKGNFKVARIGQDSTNALNQDIRVAETCFLGRNRPEMFRSNVRAFLYDVLDALREDLSADARLDTLDSGTGELVRCAPALDARLSEYLYAYYPKGGFYRRHRDALPGSASVLRSYSLLLYLNEEWDLGQRGGALRLHLDGGGDEVPEGVAPNYVDVTPSGGTLVLFKSEAIPHEVMDTFSERTAIVGWYNRAVSANDIQSLTGGDGANSEQAVRSAMLIAAGALVTVGLGIIVMGG